MEKNKHPIEVVMRHWIIFISSGILLLLKFLAIFLDVTESVPNLANIEAGKTKPKNKKSKDMVDLEINIPELIKLLD